MDYKDFGLPLLDLISEGNIGLIKAVGALTRARAASCRPTPHGGSSNHQARPREPIEAIRLPVHLVDKISKMRRTAWRSRTARREPTDEELAIGCRFRPARWRI